MNITEFESNNGGDENNNQPMEGEAAENAEDQEEQLNIFELIAGHDWDTVQALCESHPAAATIIDPVSGRSPLHMVCSIGSATADVIAALAMAAPEMVTKSDKVYQDTALHIVCRNSQKTAAKVEIILQHCSSEDILRRNVIGGTCLHSACGHNAILEVLHLIVEKNPALLKVSTFDGIPPMRGLFFSYTQSIPGVLAVGKMLKGREVNEGHFDRFWNKASFMALEYYKLTTACPASVKENNKDNNNNDNNSGEYIATTGRTLEDDYVAHGLIHSNAPLNLLKIAYKRDAACARTVDKDGNTPLHLMVERRPYRLKESEAIEATLEAFPEAAGMPNHAGHPPLMLAIRNKIPFENGVGAIFRADMTIVSRRDAETGLFPFQLSATVGGPEAFNTTFQLLSALPQQIGF